MILKKLSRDRQAQLVDTLMERYVRWRERSGAVDETYRSWNRAARGERWLAYAAYVEALDREEDAALEYRRLVELVQAT